MRDLCGKENCFGFCLWVGTIQTHFDKALMSGIVFLYMLFFLLQLFSWILKTISCLYASIISNIMQLLYRLVGNTEMKALLTERFIFSFSTSFFFLVWGRVSQHHHYWHLGQIIVVGISPLYCRIFSSILPHPLQKYL